MHRKKGTPTYAYTNPHPKDLVSLGDCVFRAISVATGKDWLTVYDELTKLGREVLAPPNDKHTYSVYLDRIATREPVIHNGKRLMGQQLARRKDGATYVIRSAGHVATVKDGKVRDTWNSGDRSAYIIWKIK